MVKAVEKPIEEKEEIKVVDGEGKVAEKEVPIPQKKIILVKGCFNHKGTKYKASQVPIVIDETIANQLIKRGVAVVPKPPVK